MKEGLSRANKESPKTSAEDAAELRKQYRKQYVDARLQEMGDSLLSEMKQERATTQEPEKLPQIGNFTDALQAINGWADSADMIAAQSSGTEKSDARIRNFQESKSREIRNLLDAVLADPEGTEALDKMIAYVNQLIDRVKRTEGTSLYSASGEQKMGGPQVHIAIRRALYEEKYRRMGITPREVEERRTGDAVPKFSEEISANDNEAKIEYHSQKLDSVRGLNMEPLHERAAIGPVPTNARELRRFGKDTFGKFESLSPTEFREQFTTEYQQTFRSVVEQKVKTLIAEKVAENVQGTYADTVASVLGNGGPVVSIMLFLSAENGGPKDSDPLLKMPFSTAARNYLDLDVEKIEPAYFTHFSRR